MPRKIDRKECTYPKDTVVMSLCFKIFAHYTSQDKNEQRQKKEKKTFFLKDVYKIHI